MKNKIKIIFYLASIILTSNLSIASELIFQIESKNVEILEKGNLVKALDGIALSEDKDIEIKSELFQYYKDINLLISEINGFARIKSKRLDIRYDSATFNQKDLTISANGNVVILKNDNSLSINSQKIFYDRKKNVISSNEITKIKDKDIN